MTDIAELVKRLRVYPANRLCVQVADALEAQAKRIEELESLYKTTFKQTSAMTEASEPACFPEWVEAKDARIAELEAAIEPFRRVKAITSIYEYVPIQALRDDEEFNFRMNGAEMKKIYALLNGEK